MSSTQQEIRDTFLAGAFAGVPIVVTVIIVRWVDQQTQVLCQPLFHRNIPFLGIALAIGGIYVLGMIVRSLLGRQLISLLDGILSRMPIIKPLYEAWKQVSLTPGGKEGMYSRVVLIATESGNLRMVGFTSGDSVPGNANMCAVFVPNSPNPITGRLFFVARSDLTFLEMSPEDALKLIVSNGNYLPEGMRGREA